MTRADFLRGWLLLTTQPWGKAYRSVPVAIGEPNPAEIQLQFYYQALEKYDAGSWQKTCQIHATGDHWPSIDTLKLTLKQQGPSYPALPAPSQWITNEEFGGDLFEAIKLQAGYRQAERTAEIYAKKGLSKYEQEYRTTAKALNLQLQAILNKNTIAPADLQRLLAIA